MRQRFELPFGFGKQRFAEREQAFRVVGKKMLLFKKQIVVLLADGVNAVTPRQQVAREKFREVIDGRLGLLDRRAQRAGVFDLGPDPGVLRQSIEKADSAPGAFDRHRGPEIRGIGFLAAQIVDALPDQCRGPPQTAEQIAGEIVGRAHRQNINRVDG